MRLRWLGACTFSLCVLACCARAPVLRAQPATLWRESQDADLAIALVTFGPGAEIHQYFGHNALLVEDRRRGIAALYNFGMFSFGPDMLPKYLRGQLEFWVAATSPRRTIPRYIRANRSVRKLELDLPPTRRRWLAARLAWHARPENRTYLYHHYNNNCSTKLRDLIDQAVDHQYRRQHSGPARLDFRAHTRRYTEHDPITHMLLMLWMNDSLDRSIVEYQEAFLPAELERQIKDTVYRWPNGETRPLVKREVVVYESTRRPPPPVPSTLWPATLAVGIVTGGLAWLLAAGMVRRKGRGLRVLYGLHHVAVGIACGVPGLVAFFLVLTEWKVSHWNENLALTNPLTFAALPLGLGIASGSSWARRWAAHCFRLLAISSVALVLLKWVPIFDQDNWIPIAWLLPVNVGFWWSHHVLVRAASSDPQLERAHAHHRSPHDAF